MMLRITGGKFRGRGIQAPPHDQTRPTQSKVRQAWFNSIQSYIPGAKFLDLFSGSGALGFEALSRGAEEVIFIESSKSVARLIEKNGESLGVSNQIKVIADRIEDLGFSMPGILSLGPFDVVLADPPYGKNWERNLLEKWPWADLLAMDGILCLEWAMDPSRQSLATKKPQLSKAKSENPSYLPEVILNEGKPLLEKSREKKYGDTWLTTYKKVEEVCTHSVEDIFQ